MTGDEEIAIQLWPLADMQEMDWYIPAIGDDDPEGAYWLPWPPSIEEASTGSNTSKDLHA